MKANTVDIREGRDIGEGNWAWFSKSIYEYLIESSGDYYYNPPKAKIVEGIVVNTGGKRFQTNTTLTVYIALCIFSSIQRNNSTFKASVQQIARKSGLKPRIVKYVLKYFQLIRIIKVKSDYNPSTGQGVNWITLLPEDQLLKEDSKDEKCESERIFFEHYEKKFGKQQRFSGNSKQN